MLGGNGYYNLQGAGTAVSLISVNFEVYIDTTLCDLVYQSNFSSRFIY
jgi:hypothetical protein